MTDILQTLINKLLLIYTQNY